MKLSDLSKNQEAIVLRVNASGELKQRLASFGLLRGANVKVIDCSLGKSTIEIMVDGTLLALRLKEAEKIEVSAKNSSNKKRERKRLRLGNGL